VEKLILISLNLNLLTSLKLENKAMKNTLLTIVFLLLSVCFVTAQNCSTFYPFSEGTSTTITTYGKNKKVAAVTQYLVTDVQSTGGSEVATMLMKMNDKRGSLIAESSYDIVCNGNQISIDFKSLISPQMTQQFANMEYEVSGTNLNLPNNLVVGQSLEDANVHLDISVSGIPMKMDVAMTERKVSATESVTTPAGTFDCFVIDYKIHMKMGMNQKGAAKQWIAEGVGLVKQEDYNNRGKVTSSSLLTALEQ
jgi:hypothetical protein